MFAAADTLFALTTVKCCGSETMGTIQANMTWVKPAPKGAEMTLTATVLRAGKSTIYGTVDFAVGDELVAQSTLIFARKPSR